MNSSTVILNKSENDVHTDEETPVKKVIYHGLHSDTSKLNNF